MSDVLKAAFPDVIPVSREVVVDQKIEDPNWLAGFVDGEGCFRVRISKSAKTKTGYVVSLEFKITQHNRDDGLMKSLVSYLDCGYYYPSSTLESGQFRVARLSDISDKILPFFDNLPNPRC